MGEYWNAVASGAVLGVVLGFGIGAYWGHWVNDRSRLLAEQMAERLRPRAEDTPTPGDR